jgi:hypothetical protein
MSDQPVVDIIVKIQAQFADTIAQSNALKTALSDVLTTITDLENKTMNININLRGMGNVEGQFKQFSKFVENSMKEISEGKGTPKLFGDVSEKLTAMNMVHRSEVKHREELEKELFVAKEITAATASGHSAMKQQVEDIKNGFVDVQTGISDVTGEAEKAASVLKVDPKDFIDFNKHLENTRQMYSSLTDADKNFIEASKKELKGVKDAFPDMSLGDIDAQAKSLVIPISAAKSEIIAMDKEYNNMFRTAGKSGGLAELKASEMIKTYERWNKEIPAAERNLNNLRTELNSYAPKATKEKKVKEPKPVPLKVTIPKVEPFDIKEGVSNTLTDVSAFVSKWKSTKMPFRNLFQLPDSVRDTYEESRASFENLRDAVKSGNIMPDLGDMDDPKRLQAVEALNQAIFTNDKYFDQLRDTMATAASHIGSFDKRARYLSRDLYIMALYANRLASSFNQLTQKMIKASGDLTGAADDISYAWTDIGESIGDAAAPALERVASSIESISDFVSGMPTGVLAVVGVFVLLTNSIVGFASSVLGAWAMIVLWRNSSIPMVKQQKIIVAQTEEMTLAFYKMGAEVGYYSKQEQILTAALAAGGTKDEIKRLQDLLAAMKLWRAGEHKILQAHIAEARQGGLPLDKIQDGYGEGITLGEAYVDALSKKFGAAEYIQQIATPGIDTIFKEGTDFGESPISQALKQNLVPDGIFNHIKDTLKGIKSVVRTAGGVQPRQIKELKGIYGSPGMADMEKVVQDVENASIKRGEDEKRYRDKLAGKATPPPPPEPPVMVPKTPKVVVDSTAMAAGISTSLAEQIPKPQTYMDEVAGTTTRQQDSEWGDVSSSTFTISNAVFTSDIPIPADYTRMSSEYTRSTKDYEAKLAGDYSKSKPSSAPPELKLPPRRKTNADIENLRKSISEKLAEIDKLELESKAIYDKTITKPPVPPPVPPTPTEPPTTAKKSNKPKKGMSSIAGVAGIGLGITAMVALPAVLNKLSGPMERLGTAIANLIPDWFVNSLDAIADWADKAPGILVALGAVLAVVGIGIAVSFVKSFVGTIGATYGASTATALLSGTPVITTAATTQGTVAGTAFITSYMASASGTAAIATPVLAPVATGGLLIGLKATIGGIVTAVSGALAAAASAVLAFLTAFAVPILIIVGALAVLYAFMTDFGGVTTNTKNFIAYLQNDVFKLTSNTDALNTSLETTNKQLSDTQSGLMGTSVQVPNLGDWFQWLTDRVTDVINILAAGKKAIDDFFKPKEDPNNIGPKQGEGGGGAGVRGRGDRDPDIPTDPLGTTELKKDSNIIGDILDSIGKWWDNVVGAISNYKDAALGFTNSIINGESPGGLIDVITKTEELSRAWRTALSGLQPLNLNNLGLGSANLDVKLQPTVELLPFDMRSLNLQQSVDNLKLQSMDMSAINLQPNLSNAGVNGIPSTNTADYMSGYTRDLSRSSSVNNIYVTVNIDKSVSQNLDEQTVARLVSDKIAKEVGRRIG